jgi:KaiC/GvpD/RAD55 family RecA-like ATPase
VFDLLRTGIDGLDAILAGGIRFPTDTAAFVFVTGGPGTGKSLLGLEIVTRAWLAAADGTSCLYYSVEQPPETLHKKLESDFDWYRIPAHVTVLPREVPHKLCSRPRPSAARRGSC